MGRMFGRGFTVPPASSYGGAIGATSSGGFLATIGNDVSSAIKSAGSIVHSIYNTVSPLFGARNATTTIPTANPVTAKAPNPNAVYGGSISPASSSTGGGLSALYGGVAKAVGAGASAVGTATGDLALVAGGAGLGALGEYVASKVAPPVVHPTTGKVIKSRMTKKGTITYRRRPKMRAVNVKAINRAGRRLAKFHKLSSKVNRHLARFAPRKHARMLIRHAREY